MTDFISWLLLEYQARDARDVTRDAAWLQSHAVALTKYEAALPRAIREDAVRKNR